MSRALRIVFLFLLAVVFAACSGDAIVDVASEGEEELIEVGDVEALPVLRLGEAEGSDQGNDCIGSGRPYHIEYGIIGVDVPNDDRGFLPFTLGGYWTDGPLCGLEFFFGYANRAKHSGGEEDSVNVGLFVYSDQPFEGAVEAGAFEEQRLRFSIDGYDVWIVSNDTTGAPLLGDGSRIPAYVLHVEGFPGWTKSSGRVIHTAMGFTPDLKFILNYESLEWEFEIDRGEYYVNDDLIGTTGGLGIQPFGWFYIYADSLHGGLFVVSDDPFGGAVEAGAFEGQELRFEIDGYAVRVTTESPALLGEGARTPAWVLHKPDFIMEDPPPGFGVSSSLEAILSQEQSGGIASN